MSITTTRPRFSFDPATGRQQFDGYEERAGDGGGYHQERIRTLAVRSLEIWPETAMPIAQIAAGLGIVANGPARKSLAGKLGSMNGRRAAKDPGTESWRLLPGAFRAQSRYDRLRAAPSSALQIARRVALEFKARWDTGTRR